MTEGQRSMRRSKSGRASVRRTESLKAVTVAERGAFEMSAISPMVSGGATRAMRRCSPWLPCTDTPRAPETSM
jgi:hypothetical protein